MNSVLDKINAALSEVDERVYYGMAPENLLRNGAPWNYTVFSREPSSRNSSKTGFTDTYAVSVVREEYVPEDVLPAVIAAMESIPGMRLSDAPVEYDYARKPNTSDIAEMMVVRFTKARKL